MRDPLGERLVHAIARLLSAGLWRSAAAVGAMGSRLDDLHDALYDAGHGISDAACEWSERRS